MVKDEYHTEKCYKLKILTTLHYVFECDENGNNRKYIKASCSIKDGFVPGFKCNGRREDGSECLSIQLY